MEEKVIADIMLVLGMLIIVTKLFEELISRRGQAPILGDILIGIIFGPTILGIITEDFIYHVNILRWIGIVSLLFLAGLETRFHVFMKSLRGSFLVALGGIVVSFMFGYFGGLALGLKGNESIFFGAILTATSVGVTVRTLSDLGILGTDLATMILGAAVIDDVGGLIVLGLCTAITTSGVVRFTELALIVTIALAFYVITLFTLHKASMRIWSAITAFERLEDTSIALLLALTLIIAWASVKVNLSLVVGAYAVGLAFSEVRGVEKVIRRFSLIPNIFASLFFVLSAALVNFRPYVTRFEYLPLMACIVALGLLSKVIGCGVAAKLAEPHISWRKAIFVGVGMMPRAEVALIIASIGLAYHIISEAVFAGTILLIYVSGLVTPIILKRMCKSVMGE